MVICDICKTELPMESQGCIVLELKRDSGRGYTSLFSRRWHGVCDNCKNSLIERLDEITKKG